MSKEKAIKKVVEVATEVAAPAIETKIENETLIKFQEINLQEKDEKRPGNEKVHHPGIALAENAHLNKRLFYDQQQASTGLIDALF
ncbi:MAG: hypothetical protein HGA35_06230, partial [Erysipelotrichaceae bacterium]|nr:hypothetical protein [Erysipelotrichaceae bacterium]